MTNFVEDNMKRSDLPEVKDTDKCLWNLGTECCGKIHNVPLFKGQLQLPVCAEHYAHNLYLMIFHKAGQDIEECLKIDHNQYKDNLNDLYGEKEINRALCEKVLATNPAFKPANISTLSDKEIFDAFTNYVG